MLQRNPLLKAYLALAAICFFWGTTYLGIRIALESFPPLTMVSLRFLVSGGVMLAGAKIMRAHLPRGRELLATAGNGVLILAVGNSCLTIAELWIPSGLAALLITAAPLWMVGVDAMLPGGDRLRRQTLLGIAIGALGVALLLAPQVRGSQAVGQGVWPAFLLLQLANFSWSLGSIRQRRLQGQAHPVVSGAVQQLAAGLVVLPFALIEWGRPIHWNLRGVGAVLYLVLFGSIVGYSAYIYAMDKLPVALVSIYTYINPIVAVWLGWMFYREPFGWWEAGAMLVVFGGVAIVKRFSQAPVAVEVD